ncbi:MAG: FAD-dependent oxidoreductase [Candidatus Rokubacteria bacterium]|nr:FAD-dependent oxidoreductase [Candidatus Rokubacteria bacterium]
MPRELGAPRPLGWSEPGRTTLEIKTGGWRTRRPMYVEATAPCRAACPAGEAVARWIELARRGELAAAWALIREANPFPAIMGRVCAHPCESACNRRQHDGGVAINALERFVGDWGLRHGARALPDLPRPGRVAVVGGGPAGLACAHALSRRGYRVRLYEAEAALGGLLRYGIPEYRLPRAVLEREIELGIGPGVEVLTGQRLGANLAWETVAGHDAVFLATGASLPLGLGVPGEQAQGIGNGLGFLRDLACGTRPTLGRRLVVVGGGSTAMDVARSARRLGVPSVSVVALEGREEMPALPEEVSQALAEGVEIRNGLGVARFVEGGGRVTGAAVVPAQLERGGDGTIRPLFRPGPSEVMAADSVLLAIGQRTDLAALPPPLRGARGLIAAGKDGATPTVPIFAGGDAASAERTVTHAVAAGMRAARRIDAVLSGGAPAAPAALPGVRALPAHVVAFAEINLDYFPRALRAGRPERPAPGRVGSFAEVVEGFSAVTAREEGARCFTCGHCVDCDNCLIYCPDMAVSRRDEGGYRLSTDHCKGCGLCAQECPRGALQMVSER